MQETTNSAIRAEGAIDEAAGQSGSQRTLRHAISCVGVGRHSGLRVGVTMHPAPPSTGVRFRRSDRPGSITLAALPARLVVAEHALIIADEDGTRIVGIEHVLAALAMTGIDNALIEVGGPELPAMDGSAQPFVFLIECAGVTDQEVPRASCPAPATVDLRRAGSRVRLQATDAPCLVTDIAGEAVAGYGSDQHKVALTREALCAELAAARQPLTVEVFEAARERGLMRGVSLDNTLLLEPTGPLNPGGLRFKDEPARHANLLALGALYLLGGLPAVELHTERAGHGLLASLLRQCAGAGLAGPIEPDGRKLGQLAGTPV
jgi:UDP-3-O-[3-hydroxymyristoyl] N-acetylglucosamine deacetylase